MTRLSDQGVKKMTPLLHGGESMRVAVAFEYPSEHLDERFETYFAGDGRDARDDLTYQKWAIAGYLAVTDSRLILAKSPMLWRVKPSHVYVDEIADECLVDWYEHPGWASGSVRVFHFRLPVGAIATAAVVLKGPGVLREADQVAFRELADGVVEAFGERARRIETPERQ